VRAEPLDRFRCEVGSRRELLSPGAPHPFVQDLVAAGDPDRLLEDGGRDPRRSLLDELERERSSDAAAQGSEGSSGPNDRPAFRWSIAIMRNSSSKCASGLIVALAHIPIVEFIAPGAMSRSGKPVPCSSK
jgi:hypothetical protein